MLNDVFGRHFTYLRLSVTDVCNFRCSYCLPDGYRCERPHHPMTLPEIERLATAFVALGIKKIRLTGGEPSVRPDLTQIISKLRQLDGLKTIAITTNGYKLPDRINDWAKAGLNALNVSVDSLDPQMFKTITGHNRLHEVLAGIEQALALNLKVKVNTVLLRGLTERQFDRFLDWVKDANISVRFIELMQTGNNRAYFDQYHLSGEVLRKQLLARGWVETVRSETAGPAIEFTHADYAGRIGLIMPYSPDFCRRCNRLRVSSEGDLHLCLFATQGYSLRQWLQSDAQLPILQTKICELLQKKSAGHQLHQGMTGMTKHLAMIGG